MPRLRLSVELLRHLLGMRGSGRSLEFVSDQTFRASEREGTWKVFLNDGFTICHFKRQIWDNVSVIRMTFCCWVFGWKLLNMLLLFLFFLILESSKLIMDLQNVCFGFYSTCSFISQKELLFLASHKLMLYVSGDIVVYKTITSIRERIP